MDADFWHQRWALDEIGFHRSTVHWALAEHWPTVQATAPGSTVLVPLCGKSLDMHHLLAMRHQVHGVELSARAVESFFDEAGWTPTLTPDGPLTHYHHGAITITQGDWFDFKPETPFDLVYDRAALIALPAPLRGPYLGHLSSLLSQSGKGLLVTMEYHQDQRPGPPFSVLSEELNAHPSLVFKPLARRDVTAQHPNLVADALTSLHESAYQISPPCTEEKSL